MNWWLQKTLQTAIALLVVVWSIVGDKGLSGQQSIARGWDVVSGDFSAVLFGYPASDLVWFFTFQTGGWLGVLGLTGVLALGFVMLTFRWEEKAGLPIGSLSLLFFVFESWFTPGPFSFLFFLVSFSGFLLESTSGKFVLLYQILWIISAPFGFVFSIFVYIFCQNNLKKKLGIYGFGLLGLVWDILRIGLTDRGEGNFVALSFIWFFGLFPILLFRVLYARYGARKFEVVAFWAANFVILTLMLGGIGNQCVVIQQAGFLPQYEHLRSFSELYRARKDLISVSLNTNSPWVRDYCRVTTGLRRCLLVSGSENRELPEGVFLIGDAEPRKSAAILLALCNQYPKVIPQVFSGTLCLLEESGPKSPSPKFQGLGVWSSAEAVMAFAWFESAQKRSKTSKGETISGLKWAWTWAELGMQKNSNDGLAWGITGELILAKHFLNAGNPPMTPMEMDAWLAQAGYCFRKSLDLDPNDKKVRRVFAGVLRQQGVLDLAETIMETPKGEGRIEEAPGDSFFLEQGHDKVMDLRHLLEYRYPGDINRSLDRIKYAVSLGLKGQALGELDRGGMERFGVEGAKIRLNLLLQSGFADLSAEIATVLARQGADLGLVEWKRPGGGAGLGATWKLPTLPWVQTVSHLAMNPHGRHKSSFGVIKKSLSEDFSKVRNRVLKDLPLVLAKNVLMLPGNPLALRIEGAMEYANRESLAQLGLSIEEELMALDRLENESGGF